MYVGETFGVEKGLYPAPGPKRGEAMRWIVWTNVTLGDAVGRWTRNTLPWVPAEQQNAKAGEAGLADVHDLLRILDEALDGRQFLCGNDTLADTHVSAYVDWLRRMKLDTSAYEHLQAWVERCSARPAYIETMQAEAE